MKKRSLNAVANIQISRPARSVGASPALVAAKLRAEHALRPGRRCRQDKRDQHAAKPARRIIPSVGGRGLAMTSMNRAAVISARLQIFDEYHQDVKRSIRTCRFHAAGSDPLDLAARLRQPAQVKRGRLAMNVLSETTTEVPFDAAPRRPADGGGGARRAAGDLEAQHKLAARRIPLHLFLGDGCDRPQPLFADRGLRRKAGPTRPPTSATAWSAESTRTGRSGRPALHAAAWGTLDAAALAVEHLQRDRRGRWRGSESSRPSCRPTPTRC